MDKSSKSPLRPSKRQISTKETQNKAIVVPNGERSTPTNEELFASSDQEQIREKLAPAFYFNGYRGRRLAFGMKNGDTFVADVGAQQWQFLQLYNVVVESEDGKKEIKSRMINVDRIDYFDIVGDEEQKAS